MIVKLKSTDGSTSRDVALADVQFVIRREGGHREKSRPAASIALQDGSTNVLSVFDDKGEFICSIGYAHDRYHSSGGLFICG